MNTMNINTTSGAVTGAAVSGSVKDVGEESKRMKDYQLSNDTNGDSITIVSQLPEKALRTIQKGMKDGFDDNELFLGSRYIEDEMMPELCDWIIKLGDKVKILIDSIQSNNFTSKGAVMLFDCLRNSQAGIKHIDINFTKIFNEVSMKSLGEYIKQNKSIESILISSTQVSDVEIEILTPYLNGNTTLKRLDLSSNKNMTDKSIPFLMKMIETSKIEKIHIYNTSITNPAILEVPLALNALKHQSNCLRVSIRSIDDADIITICEAMKKYGINNLRLIEIQENKITSKAAGALFNTLVECNSAVKKIDLVSNHLDDECMIQLGELIQHDKSLEYVNLIDNFITSKGVEILSEYLIGDTSLKILNIGSNAYVTDASVPFLIDIAKKSHVTNINMHETTISQESKQIIQDLLSIPIDQREIPIKSNTKSAAKISSSATSTI